VQLKTAITSGKKRTGLQDSQEDCRAGIHEASTQDVQRILENEEMDLVERSAPSKTKKAIMHRLGAGNVRAPTTGDNFALPFGKIKRNR
jgi:hypothetical protein